VLSALFTLMERHENYWKKIQGSTPVETFGFEGYVEPEPVNVDLGGMIDLFKTGYQQFRPLWKDIFSERCFAQISKTAEMEPGDFHFPTSVWGPTLYELAATFHSWTANRNKLLDLMTPLYFARVASFVKQSEEMSSLEAEALVEEQAAGFEEHKDYLIKVWDQKSKQKTKSPS